MTSTVPTNSRSALFAEPPAELPILDGPADLIEEYLQLAEERRALDERLAYVRAELELVAAATLHEGMPRGRFVAAHGAISARLQPTCTFDKPAVARELQRAGRLAEVAIVQGPALARFLAKEPQLSARLAEYVRHRKGVVLMTGV